MFFSVRISLKMSYIFCLIVTLKEHKDMISYFLFLNSDFDSLPNDEKWTYVSTLNDPHTNYVYYAILYPKVL